MDLRTEKEKQRDMMHEKVRQMYLSLSCENPEASANRVFSAVANRFGLTSMGVRRIVERAGLYQSKRV